MIDLMPDSRSLGIDPVQIDHKTFIRSLYILQHHPVVFILAKGSSIRLGIASLIPVNVHNFQIGVELTKTSTL